MSQVKDIQAREIAERLAEQGYMHKQILEALKLCQLPTIPRWEIDVMKKKAEQHRQKNLDNIISHYFAGLPSSEPKPKTALDDFRIALDHMKNYKPDDTAYAHKMGEMFTKLPSKHQQGYYSALLNAYRLQKRDYDSLVAKHIFAGSM